MTLGLSQLLLYCSQQLSQWQQTTILLYQWQQWFTYSKHAYSSSTWCQWYCRRWCNYDLHENSNMTISCYCLLTKWSTMLIQSCWQWWHFNKNGNDEICLLSNKVNTTELWNCCVCKVKENWNEKMGLSNVYGELFDYGCLASCTQKYCSLVAQTLPMDHKRYIFCSP